MLLIQITTKPGKGHFSKADHAGLATASLKAAVTQRKPVLLRDLHALWQQNR